MDKFWKQITPSDYAWEQEALPDHEPYRAWASFEFSSCWLKSFSFDELLLRLILQHCNAMKNSPNWQVVLKADAAEPASRDWVNRQRLVQQVMPAIAAEIKQSETPVRLTEPGLIARYDLIRTWLNELRQHLMNAGRVQALVLLIAGNAQRRAPVIDGKVVPVEAGSST